MEVVARMEAPCTVERLYREIHDLGGYPRWMSLTREVAPAGTDDRGRPAWHVDLIARVGPFARSKRLRMVRTVDDPAAGHARFERAETDGKRHAAWVLDAVVRPTDAGAAMEMRLSYSGSLWTGGVLERTLAEQIEAGRQRLLELVSG